MGNLEHAGMSRRTFLSASAGAGAAAALGLAGCSASSSSESASADETSESTESTTDWLGSDPDITEDDIVETLETDLLIVGAGNGGMMAAATACDEGLDFILCEKTDSIQTTRHWVGVVNSSLTEEAGIEVDENKLLNELTRYASGNCNQRVWKVWLNESRDMFEYVNGIMSDKGYPVFLDTEVDEETGGTDYYVPVIQHMWYESSLSHPLLISSGQDASICRNGVLQSYIEDAGHEVTFGYELVSLLREDGGAVTGGIFSTDEGYVQINANKAVLLTTGGYAADPVMVQDRNPVVNRCTTAAAYSPNCTGDGIKAALRIGADMDAMAAAMLFDRGAVAPGVDAGYVGEGSSAAFPSSYPFFTWGMSQPFLKVNRNGERFMNESAPYDTTVHQAAKQPGGVYALICDSNIVEDMTRFATIGCAKVAVLSFQSLGAEGVEESLADAFDAGIIFKADTLEELADALELPSDTFLATVERYNELYEAQNDEDFGKEAYRLSSISEPPYYGVWLGGTLLTTIDGLLIDENMRVLDENNEVIEGLYAAGDCSGSVFSGNYPEYIVGSACGRTLTEARHAVLQIAQL